MPNSCGIRIAASTLPRYVFCSCAAVLLQYLINSSTSHHFSAHMQSNAPKPSQAPVFVEEWHGWWELDRQKLALQLRLEFASGGKLFGDGHDSHCQFQLGGSYASTSFSQYVFVTLWPGTTPTPLCSGRRSRTRDPGVCSRPPSSAATS